MKCEGCMFQRYRMTEDGQAWFCRRESSDEVPVLHYECASEKDCFMGLDQKVNKLVAYDSEGNVISEGMEITDFRGDKYTLVKCLRENEFRYGGGRSGQVRAKDDHGFESVYYDKVFDLEIRNTEKEVKACAEWIQASIKNSKEDSE